MSHPSDPVETPAPRPVRQGSDLDGAIGGREPTGKHSLAHECLHLELIDDVRQARKRRRPTHDRGHRSVGHGHPRRRSRALRPGPGGRGRRSAPRRHRGPCLGGSRRGHPGPGAAEAGRNRGRAARYADLADASRARQQARAHRREVVEMNEVQALRGILGEHRPRAVASRAGLRPGRHLHRAEGAHRGEAPRRA